MKKIIVLILALSLIVGCAVGATIAWLADSTQNIANTFTVGNINIDLNESDADNDENPDENDYKMVPGNVISKDPYVTVKNGSESCWLFITVEESTDPVLDNYIKYKIDTGWTALKADSNPAVYYRRVDATTKDETFKILAGDEYLFDINKTANNTDDDMKFTWGEDQVLVLPTVTKPMMDALTAFGKLPTLEFKAYAIQQENIADAQIAWAQIQASIQDNSIATEPPATSEPAATVDPNA